MNEKEFRIGNFFEPTDGSKKEFEIVTAADLSAWERGAVYGHKIPLDEHWFFLFGFKRIDQEKRGKTYAINSTYELWQGTGHGWYPIISMSQYQFQEIFYVHQLQNFYFALAEKELITI